MKNKNILYIAVFLIVIILCVIGILALQARPAQGVADIYLEGELVRSVEWAGLQQPMEIPIGEGNIICADGEGVWMKHADCPDQLCVKQGKIKGGALSIVCLPNRVTVTLRSPKGELDGVAR